MCASTIRNSRTKVKGGACTGNRGHSSHTIKLRNVLFPSRSEDDSISDLLAKDPEFLTRVAGRLQNLTHAVPFSISPDFYLLELDSQLLPEREKRPQV